MIYELCDINKNMKTQKGSVLITVLVIILIAGGAFWYLNNIKQAKELAEPEQTEEIIQEEPLTEPVVDRNENKINTSGKVKTFEGETDLGKTFSFDYSDALNVINNSPNSVSITKLNSDRVIRPMDCGGFLATDEELKMTAQIYSPENEGVQFIEKRYNKGEILFSFSNGLVKGEKNIPGMCENGDELILKIDDVYVVFDVAPTNTNLVEEYTKIIKTFKLK
jgi:hypothetical protein